jgi:hypothetical protein
MASSTKSSWISWRLLNNFLFYRVGLLALRLTPNLENQASIFISPRGRVATHFSRLLRICLDLIIITPGKQCTLWSSSLCSTSWGQYSDQVSNPGRDNDRTFLLRHRVQTRSEAHPGPYPMGTGGCFTGLKRPEHETHRTHPSNAKVNDVCNYTSTSPIRLHCVVI